MEPEDTPDTSRNPLPRTNAKTEIMRLFIEGDMTAKDAK